jgi:transcriptional regulator with XRE-family HTH domain
MNKLVNNIERRMKRMGLTQKALALKAGLNETAVRDILKGRSRDPQLSTLRALGRILGCTVEELYKGNAGRAGYGVADRQQPWPANAGGKAKNVDEDDAPDSLFVEELDITAAGSPSALLDGRARKVAGTWQMPDDVFGKRFPGNQRELFLVKVEGDAMVPDFMPGDRVMINTADVMPSPSGVFLVWDGAGLILRRCEIKPNTKPLRITLRARNPDYGAHEVSLKEVTVCGRVVGRWHRV